MVYSLVRVRNIIKKKKKDCVFILLNNMYCVIYSFSFFLKFNLCFFFKAKLFFFFNLYYLFFEDIPYIKKVFYLMRKFLFFFYLGNSANCFTNLQNRYQVTIYRTFIEHKFKPRNFFITHRSLYGNSFFAGGRVKRFRPGEVFRRLKYTKDNFIRCIKIFFRRFNRYFFKRLVFLFRGLFSRVSLSLRVFFLLTKDLNKKFKNPWMRIFEVYLFRNVIFGYMTGVRKPRRKRRLVKRRGRRLY